MTVKLYPREKTGFISGLMISLFFTVFGIIWLTVSGNFGKSNWLSVTGTITAVDHDHTVAYCTYTVGGEIKTNKKLDSYSSTYKAGDSIALLVNPSDYNDFTTDTSKDPVFGTIGYLFAVGGVYSALLFTANYLLKKV